MARPPPLTPLTHILCCVLVTGAAGVGGAPHAHAWEDSTALNGTFTARSDGLWAKTNEIMAYQADAVATWTITSSCTTFQDCTGTVVSDQGWTADLVYQSQRWRVTHIVEGGRHAPPTAPLPPRVNRPSRSGRSDSTPPPTATTGSPGSTRPSAPPAGHAESTVPSTSGCRSR